MIGFTMPSHRAPLGTQTSVQALQRIVSAEYFAALGIRIREGRSFAASDARASGRVAVVNRTFAKRYLKDNPVGERLPGFFDNPCCNVDRSAPEVEVIGVADDIYHQSVTETVQPEVYVPLSQIDASRLRTSQPSLVLRTSENPRAFVPILKSIVREADKDLTLDAVMTMEDRVSTSLARPRLYAVLLGSFAVFALLIAAVGLFGVLSFTVAQRSREIAVRSAVGASPAQILRLILRQALGVTLGGMLAGLWIASVAVRYLSTFLFGVSQYDLLTFSVVPVVLLSIAALACIVPARRAMQIEPVNAMRN
jgi:putative ABC transport system permease protein